MIHLPRLEETSLSLFPSLGSAFSRHQSISGRIIKILTLTQKLSDALSVSREKRQCGCCGQSACGCCSGSGGGGGGISGGGMGGGGNGQCYNACLNQCSRYCITPVCVSQCPPSCQQQCGVSSHFHSEKGERIDIFWMQLKTVVGDSYPWEHD